MTENLVWAVVVEESTNARTFQYTHREVVGPRDLAVARAMELARTHRPQLPPLQRSRAVFEQPDGSFLVLVTGALAEAPFRVHVLRYMASFDSSGALLG